ncbi:MAG: hypothetical protein U9N30_05950, partial [Campylobacterota bacterium]|nr:hypothetical protein [Campylobacterota bacterium]
KCYAEGGKVALSVDASLKNTQQKTFVKIDVSKNIQWYFPSMIDPQTKKEKLCTLRLNKAGTGKLKVTINDTEVWSKQVIAHPFISIDIPWMNFNLKEEDSIRIEFQE